MFVVIPIDPRLESCAKALYTQGDQSSSVERLCQEFRFEPQRRYADDWPAQAKVRGVHEAVSTTGRSLLDEQASSAN